MIPAFTALADVLAQTMEVIRQLPDDEYVRPGPAGVSGSVGKHVRHCLDHVIALEESLRTRQIDYDARHRGTVLESNHRAAIAALESVRARLLALDDRWLSGHVEVVSQLAPHRRPIVVNSTIGRELAFVISHTIHHNATINVLLKDRRVITPPGFGYAASSPCALSA
jgi:uncharacterized damage-inducible protein DinB